MGQQIQVWSKNWNILRYQVTNLGWIKWIIKIVDIVDSIFLEKNYCKVKLKYNGFLIFDKKVLAVGQVEKGLCFRLGRNSDEF